MVKVKDNLVGRQFGRLVVLEQVDDYIKPSNGEHVARWLCECTCSEHTRKIVVGAKLKDGSIQSCGCLCKERTSEANLKDLTGKTFGRLTVIQRAEDRIKPNGKHKVMWLCECSCKNHNQVIVWGGSLQSGRTKSCGCLLEENRKTMHRKYNQYDLSGDFGILWSTNTNEEVYFDIEDAEKILQYGWCVGTNGYATACIDGKMTRMHAFLNRKWHDHHNRNKLDNRKENLVPCTIQENSRNRSITKRNTSGFIGVYWSETSQKWQAQIKIDQKIINLGGFDNKYDAIVARLEAEAKYFDEFAPQRHLFEQYNIKTIQND